MTDNIVATEGFPLLSKRSDSSNSDHSSTDGTIKTYDTYCFDELSSCGSNSNNSNEFHQDHQDHQGPSSIEDSSPHVDDDEHEAEHEADHEAEYEDCDETETETETLPPLMEGMAEEFHDITEAALDELHKADEDENYMIEMGLTRNFSLLHDDVVEASGVLLQAPEDDDTDYKYTDIELGHKQASSTPPSSSVIPWSVYMLLGSAIVAMSTVGPLLQLQDDTTATMKIVWRMVGTSFLLTPLALTDMYEHGGIPKLTTPQWFTFFLSTFCYSVMSIGFCLSLDYTAVGNAVILSNSLALILLVGKLFTGTPVTVLELTGAMVAFGGAVLCSRDAADGEAADNINSNINDTIDQLAVTGSAGLGKTFIGDLLAIVSAIGGVGYVTFAKTSRAHMPLYIFMFLTMTMGCAMVLTFQVVVLQETVTWDCDITHGIGGFLVWQRFDRLPLELMMVVICNLAGTMGYVRAMPHFDSLVICSVQLLEPVIAEFLSYFAGVGMLPGLVGWIGNAAVAGGTFVVLYESQKCVNNSEKKDVQ